MRPGGAVLALVLAVSFLFLAQARAVWIWTPESGRWVNPKWEPKETPEAQFEWAESFEEAGDYKRAAKEYEKLVRAYPDSVHAPEAQLRAGRCYERLGKYAAAAEAYRKVVEQYPESPDLAEAREGQLRLGEAIAEGNGGGGIIGSLWERISRGNRYERAAKVYQDVVEEAPYSEMTPDALMRLGQVYMKSGDYLMAAWAFQQVADRYPGTAKAEEALFRVAESHAQRSLPPEYDQSATDDAIEAFQFYLTAYPRGRFAEEAAAQLARLRAKRAESLLIVARFYERKGSISAARVYYEEILRDWADTPAAGEAREALAAIERALSR